MDENNSDSNPPEETIEQHNTPAEDSIAQVFAEDVIEVQDISSSEVDESDFAVDISDSVKDGEEKTAEEKKDPGEKDPAGEKKKSAEASKGANEKNDVIRKMFNPDAVLLIFDIMAKKGGRMATPDRPDYFRMSDEDRQDFSKLLKLTAEEEDWSSIPTKYLLGIAGAFWIFGKVYKWNKPHLWDEKEMGDKFVKPADEKTIADNAIAEYVRTKARADSEGENKDLRGMLEQLAARAVQQDKNIANLLAIIQSNVPGADQIPDNNIHDVAFTEIAPEKFLHGYDMDIIDFTENGALIDQTKAGLSGFNVEGMKIGRPTKQDGEIWAHWKQYQAWKNKHLKVA